MVKLEEIIDITNGIGLNSDYYTTQGKYNHLTCGNLDYVNNSLVDDCSCKYWDCLGCQIIIEM